MEDDYFVIDIETCPLDLEHYKTLNEEERKKLINPIDSKIIAIGIRHNKQNKVFMGEEKQILEEFWKEWKNLRDNFHARVVGFNITNFDIPSIVTRSLIHNVQIVPFIIKNNIVDLREKLSAYRYGETRGKLKDFAVSLGLDVKEINGSHIGDLCIEGKFDLIKDYLIHDLEITDALYQRVKETNILKIERW